MRKTLFLIILTLLPMLANADAVEIDGIYYNLLKKLKTAEVTSKPSGYYNGDVTIPETVTYNDITYNVTSIGDYAFQNCTGLVKISIPNSVTSLGGQAFYGCSGLTSVTIPDSVISIGAYVFTICNSLESLTIGNSVKSIPNTAFGGCTKLKSVTIPNSVTSIGERAFIGCSNLTNVTIGNSVTEIGKYAFSDCNSLYCMTIGQGVKSISEDIFGDLGKTHSPAKVIWLASTPPSGIRVLGKMNFVISNLYSFGEVYELLPFAFEYDGFTYVPISQSEHTCALMYCDDVTKFSSTNIIIPESVQYNGSFYSVTKISGFAFQQLDSLTSVTIPNSVTNFGDHAFSDCTGLTSVTIPNSVNNIGDYAFTYCTGLTSVTIPNSVTNIGDCAFTYCTGLTSVTIPNSVTNIGDCAFSCCDELKIVYIDSGVKKIGVYAFADCPEIMDVFCYADSVPNANIGAFSDSYIEYATLHVPVGSLDDYKKAEPWKNFGTIKAVDHIKGDANSDNDVNADDVTELANAIIDKPSDKYKKEAADMNNDGKVDATDITRLVDILLE